MPYNTADAVNPEQYKQLLEERYGPLDALLTEIGLSPPPPPRTRATRKRPWRLNPVSPDQAARNYADLADAIGD